MFRQQDVDAPECALRCFGAVGTMCPVDVAGSPKTNFLRHRNSCDFEKLVASILEAYPKIRPPLPEAIRRIYVQHYKLNRGGQTPATSLAQRAERWLHRRVAEDVGGPSARCSTLEIGAGTLNQLQYEPEVGPYDIVEPFRELFDGSPALQRIRNVYADVSQVPLTARYDRITSVATFEHLCDLPAVVATCGLLLAASGRLRVSIPSEGTVLWTVGWRLTTGLEYRLKYGLDYALLMRHEHVNTAAEIEAVLRHFFAQVRTQVFGLSRRFSLYQFFECAAPDAARCADYLQSVPWSSSGTPDVG